jgi:hypothetical protein
VAHAISAAARSSRIPPDPDYGDALRAGFSERGHVPLGVMTASVAKRASQSARLTLSQRTNTERASRANVTLGPHAKRKPAVPSAKLARGRINSRR